MASIGDTHDLNRLPPDDAGRQPSVPTDSAGEGHPLLYGANGEVLTRIPSVPTDADGTIPLRARLDAIISAAKGAATPSEVEAFVEGLASTLATLRQEHETLQGKHADLIEQLGQVLDAVGQIPTEQSGGSGYVETDWQMEQGGAVATEPGGEVEVSFEQRFFERFAGRLIFEVEWEMRSPESAPGRFGAEHIKMDRHYQAGLFGLQQQGEFPFGHTNETYWSRQGFQFLVGQPRQNSERVAGEDYRECIADVTFTGLQAEAWGEIRNSRCRIHYRPVS